MEDISKPKIALVLALVVMASACVFFYRLYTKDMRALADFQASYQAFDAAISDFSRNPNDASGSKAQTALDELKKKSVFRLSSLIKHEKEVMNQARVIADLSGRELESLRAYEKAIANKSAEANALAKAYGDLSSERKAAYAQFQELGRD